MIDKDLAAARLATDVSADALLVLTDVHNVFINYKKPDERALGHVTLDEMETYAAAGHFKAGSMGPKVEACLRFARTGGEAIVAGLTEVVEAMSDKAGTHIVAAAPAGFEARPNKPADRQGEGA